MNDQSSRGIANLATRPVDPKRMLARNRQADNSPDVVEATYDASRDALEPVVDSAGAPGHSQRSPRKPSAEAKADVRSLARKDTRLREEQISDLTAHARRLNKAKTSPAPRITENTLIRVAIDLLLSRAGDLGGNTEAELRNSVGL